MNLSAANTYLRISAKHKPEMLQAAGSDLNVARWTHGVFSVFAEALKGNESCIAFLDRNVKLAAQGPSELMLMALAEMNLEAHAYAAVAGANDAVPETPPGETPWPPSSQPATA